MGRDPASLACDQIAPDIRLDRVTGARLERDRLAEHRPGIHTRMKLAALTARVDRRRQIAEQRAVELPADETRIELPSVDTGQPRAKAAVDHLFGKLPCRNAPDGKERIESRSRELLLAIAADVLEKQIAERHVRKPVLAGAGHRG